MMVRFLLHSIHFLITTLTYNVVCQSSLALCINLDIHHKHTTKWRVLVTQNLVPKGKDHEIPAGEVDDLGVCIAPCREGACGTNEKNNLMPRFRSTSVRDTPVQ
jgi:hypothetical protein